MLQIGNKELQYIIDVRKLDPRKLLQEISKKTVIGHNIKFDYQVIKNNFDVTLENLFDTMLAAQILECGLDEEKGHFTLERTATRYTGINRYSNQGDLFAPTVTKKIRESFAHVGDNPFTQEQLYYGALDVSVAYLLYEKEMALLKENELMSTAELEFEFVKVLGDMELSGVYLNQKQWLENYRVTLKNTEELRSQLLKYRELNWDSHKQVLPVMKQLGVDVSIIDKKTGEIKESVSRQVVKKQSFKDDILKIYLDYKLSQKASSTYGEKFLRHVNPTSQRIHSNYMQIMRTGRTSSTNPNCYSKDTEIMTDRGWVRFDELTADANVAQWEDGNIQFVKPTGYVKTFKEKLINIKTDKHIDLLVTEDHRCLIRDRKTLKLKVLPAKDYPEDAHQIHSGVVTGGINLSRREILNWKLAIALQADGSIQPWGVTFIFKKNRKQERLAYLLNEANITYNYNVTNSGKHRFYISRKDFIHIINLLDADKTLPYKLWEFNEDALYNIYNEVFYWDGLFTRKNTYASVKKKNVDVLQGIATLIGKRPRLRIYKNKYWNCDISNTDYSMTTNIVKSYVDYNDYVYCVEVPSSYVVVRRNGKVAVSGNCQNISRGSVYRSAFQPEDNNVFVGADFSNIEARILADKSGDENFINIFINNGDYHLETAKLAFDNPNLTKQSEERQLAKTINFAIAFGAGAKKVSEGAGVTLAKGKELLNKVYTAFPKLLPYFIEQGNLTRERGYVVTNMVSKRRSYIPFYKEYLAAKAHVEYFKSRG